MGFRGSFACAAEVAISVMLLAEARAQAPAPDPGASWAERGSASADDSNRLPDSASWGRTAACAQL